MIILYLDVVLCRAAGSCGEVKGNWKGVCNEGIEQVGDVVTATGLLE